MQDYLIPKLWFFLFLYSNRRQKKNSNPPLSHNPNAKYYEAWEQGSWGTTPAAVHQNIPWGVCESPLAYKQLLEKSRDQSYL